MTPKLVIKSQPVDLLLTELLGDKPRDFLVMTFDGVHLDFFGTPLDTVASRAIFDEKVKRLNDHSGESLWVFFWENWHRQIRKQFNLPETTTEKDFRPNVSYVVSRVCPGYSEHLHCAIGLFETLRLKISCWNIASNSDGTDVNVLLTTPDHRAFGCADGPLPLAIVKTMIDLLESDKSNPITTDRR